MDKQIQNQIAQNTRNVSKVRTYSLKEAKQD